MRNTLLSIILCFSATLAFCQGTNRIKLTQLEKSKTVEGTKAGQIPLTNSSGDLRYAQYVEIDLVPIGFVPTATGNTSNYSEFVTASDGSRWYIDWQGRGFQFVGATTDQNGYYGGNGGNGGDATIPSVTTSTLTNQLTWYLPLDDAGGLVPLRLQVDEGNESDFMSFRQGLDSLLISRSDQEFVQTSTKGFILIAADIMGIFADSIQISTVPNAFPKERTFLSYSPNNTITKKEGIDATDLNFSTTQTISASGTGPTAYNIDLSGGGGFITLTEGANIDLTRSGNNITIASTGGGGGSGYLTIQEEGVSLPSQSTLNFVGSAATAADATTKTNVTFDSDVNALADIATQGIYIITGPGTSTTRTLVAPAAGLTISNANGVGANPTFALANDLAALEALSGTGFPVRTATDTWTQRSVVAGTGSISITNGDGVGGNIAINNTDPDQSTSNEIQSISASGAGPTAYNIDLSLGGGFITLTEGANIDLTRSGNNITIAASGGSSGYMTIQEEGTSLTQRTILNFVGSAATAADATTKTDVTFDSDVNALADIATQGIYIITGPGTSTTRTLVAPAAGLTISNANGVGANPTFALANDLAALEALSGTGFPVRTATDTWTQRSVVAGTGSISITNGDGVGGNIAINNTDPDQSTSNEIQAISASGAGPTAYNIDLSLGGGSVTLTEGANIDLTRSGNNITIASALNQSIYTADGIVFADCDATLQSGKYFQFDWFGGNNAFEINDLSNYSILKSKDTQGSIRVDNSSINATRWNAGFTEYSQWYITNAAAEMDYNNEVVFQCNTNGFQCISTTNTLQPPQMTTAQKNAIFPIFDGGVVFDTDLNKWQFREGGTWLSLFTPGGLFYQTIKVNGGTQPQENFVNYTNTSTVTFTGTDVPGSAWTKIEANIPTGGITSTQILDGTITAADLNQMSATTGQAMVWNGSAWVAADVPSSTTTTNFSSSGTFTVNGAKSIDVYLVAGGGGGGSGRKGPAGANRYGGGGGSAGGVSMGAFSLSELGNPSSITVTVGTGGAGGVAKTVNGTNGSTGAGGGETSLSISGTKFIAAKGGFGGAGGSAGAGLGGAGVASDFASNAGGNGSGNGVGTATINSLNKCGGSGGGGGGISTANATQAATDGGDGYYSLCAGGALGGAGVNGSVGTAPSGGRLTGGGGGGGGVLQTAGASGSGGAGAIGGGGGGGAAGLDSFSDSGAGGAGGDGFVKIIAHY